MRKLIITAAALALVASGSTACATKKFVTGQVGQVSSKVDSLSKSLEETQERTKANEARISQVDQAVKAVDGKAATAQQTAMTADGKAVAATETANTAVAKAETVAKGLDTVEKASRKMIYEVVLSEDSGNFKFGTSKLPDESKAKIDELITKLLADPKGAYFEIEGHTDNVGDKMVNEKLGAERAETVKRYLYQQHNIPLHRINVISYGEDKPVVDNKTSANRAQNRRVVIRVLV
jgi:outer membrane protein OmpA-like peptidoglycan-associated protein